MHCCLSQLGRFAQHSWYYWENGLSRQTSQNRGARCGLRREGGAIAKNSFSIFVLTRRGSLKWEAEDGQGGDRINRRRQELEISLHAR